MPLLPHAGQVRKGPCGAWQLCPAVQSALASLPLAFFSARLVSACHSQSRLASVCHSESRFVGRRISLCFRGIVRFWERFFATLRMTGQDWFVLAWDGQLPLGA